MKKSKRIISIFLVVATLFLMSINSFAATNAQNKAVNYCIKNGYIKGYANGLIGTDDKIQRQDFAVMLLRYGTQGQYIYGKPMIASGKNPVFYNNTVNNYIKRVGQFKDVPSNAYYTESINKLRYEGIIAGYQNGKFGVGDSVTVEQAVTFLYRYAGCPTVMVNDMTKMAKYSDRRNVSRYSEAAMAWAINSGVYTGTVNKLNPTQPATRGQVAQMLYNLDRLFSSSVG